MKRELLELLCCSACKHGLFLDKVREVDGEIESGSLLCEGCAKEYRIIQYIPRFVPPENYAKTFGFQWNLFKKTQLDSHTGVPISRECFFGETGWKPDELDGKLILDVGCGAGRFAEVALSCGARVVALDYSTAVDACRENLSPHPELDLVQGDIYHLPFKSESFDYVYCLGVLQHTPDVKRAFLALPDQLRPGGKLVIDVYPKLFLNIMWPKYWIRPLTKRMPHDRLFKMVEAMVRYLLPFSTRIGRIPLLGRKLRYAIPVANYEGIYPLSKERLREWALMDTFDMLSPVHDHAQSVASVTQWFINSGLKDIDVFRRGVIVGRGVKPSGKQRVR